MLVSSNPYVIKHEHGICTRRLLPVLDLILLIFLRVHTYSLPVTAEFRPITEILVIRMTEYQHFVPNVSYARVAVRVSAGFGNVLA